MHSRAVGRQAASPLSPSDPGVVREAGVAAAADDDGVFPGIEALGLKVIQAEEVLDLVEKTIQRQPVAREEARVIVALELWSKLALDAAVHRDPRFGTLRLSMRGAGLRSPCSKI
ncbi:hypothetical protein DL766_004776 [Monosporascus sp. MC13-8B]|uniref:Uncharacterized protein n=1 Tax=Monosporascus cannonballus TaxID=155416 RepID=A0ABY0H5F9_9PEZI|nr:hypothetical protein DL762_005231 [Monosporascus cannonballus]RYO96700.1 hypothetical protein DL763_003076 [Monosporascus cannonballus]RYP30680.1 hypothetical protein DL766_004776 [Monosporascus sp. MC13-8B]